jgi:autotransporter-associated beta strand protein
MSLNAGNQSVGGINVTNTRTSNLLIGNSSSTTNGLLTLNGSSINSVNGTIIRNNSSQLFTIQNTQGSGTNSMGINIPNANSRITIDGTGGVTISSAISGSGSLLKSGAGGGNLILSNTNNSYTGGTSFLAGSLQLGASNVIPNTGNIVFSGGILRTANFSETTGAVNLTANSEIILGFGTHTLNFANSSAISWITGATLTIRNWIGTVGSSGIGGRIFFGTNGSGLTCTQLSQIVFEGFTGTSTLLSNGELVPFQAPIAPSSIFNNGTTFCPNTNFIGFNVASVVGATIYNWTVPAGWVINSGQGTTSISVTSGNLGQNGNISVTASNACSMPSAAATLAVSVAPTNISWTGNVSSDWNNQNNWSPTKIPGSCDNVTIGNSSLNPCVINNAGVYIVNNLTINGNGIFNITNSASFTVNGNLTSGGTANATFSTGSTFFITSTSNQPIPAFTYGSLNTSGGQRTFATTGTIRILGNFTPGAGPFNIANSTLRFESNSGFVIPAITSTTAGKNYFNLEIAGSGVWTLANNLSIQNNFTYLGTNALYCFNGSIANSYTLNVDANFTIAPTATGTVHGNFSNTTGANLTINIGGNFNLSGGQFIGTSNNGALQLNLTGSFNQNGGNAIIANGTANAIATITIGGNYTINSNNYFYVSKSDQCLGTFNLLGSYNQNNGTFFGSYFQTAGSMFNVPSNINVSVDFNINGGTFSAICCRGTNTTSILGNIYQTAGSIIVADNNGSSVFSANGTYNSSGGVFIGATRTNSGWAIGGSASLTFGNVVLSNLGNLLLHNSILSPPIIATVNGNITLSGNSIIRFEDCNGASGSSTTTSTLICNGNFSSTSSGISVNSTNSFLDFGDEASGNYLVLRGNLNKSGIGQFIIKGTQGASGIKFSKNGTQTINYVGATSNTISYIVEPTSTLIILTDLYLGVNNTLPIPTFTVNGALDFGTYLIYGLPTSAQFIVNVGGTIKSANNFGLYGANGSLTGIAASISINPAANFEFNGFFTQNTNFGSTINQMNNLTINNGGGAVNLDKNILVNGALNIVSGRVNISSHILSIGASGSVTVTNPSINNMIVADGTGELRKFFTGPTTFTYPIGDLTGSPDYSPVTLAFSSGLFFTNAYVGIRVNNTQFTGSGSTNYLKRHWILSPSNIPAFDCIGSFNYSDNDVQGSESAIYGGLKSGSGWICLNQVISSQNKIEGLFSFFGNGIVTGGEFLANLTSSLINPQICSPSPFIYNPTSNAPAAGFSWTRAPIPGITPSTSNGTGGTFESLVNATSNIINVQYVFTTTGDVCPTSTIVTVPVGPSPQVNFMGDLTFCNGTPTTPILITGIPTGSVYNVSGGTSIGMPNQNGVNYIDVFTPISGSANIIITPYVFGCYGTPIDFQIDVISSAQTNYTSVNLCDVNTSDQLTVVNHPNTNYVWSPAIGLYTDALLSTPYILGTNATSVYASPITSTTYSVTSINSLLGCVTAPTNIQVNVCSLLTDVICGADASASLNVTSDASFNLINNFGATTSSQAGTCAPFVRDVWYRAIVPDNGEIHVITQQNGNDVQDIQNVVVSLFKSSNNTCNGTLTPLDCNNGGAVGEMAYAHGFGLIPGEMVYIRIAAHASSLPVARFIKVSVSNALIWNGAFDSNFSNPANYIGGDATSITFPNQNRSVIINASSSGNYPIVNGIQDAHGIYFNSNIWSVSNNLTISPGSELRLHPSNTVNSFIFRTGYLENSFRPNVFGKGLLRFNEGGTNIGEVYPQVSFHCAVGIRAGVLGISYGNMVFENNAVLLSGGVAFSDPNKNYSGSVLGDIVFKRNGSPYGIYNYWSAPVSGASTQLLLSSYGNNIYQYNNSLPGAVTNVLQGWGSPITSPIEMEIGKGYIQTYAGNGNVTFTGYPVESSFPVPVYVTATNNFNLLGNPYPSSLSYSRLRNSNPNLGATYLWSFAGFPPYSSSSYVVLSGLGVPAGNVVAGFNNGEIAACQGFFAEVNGNGYINFDSDQRVAGYPGNSVQFLEQENNFSILRLRLTNPHQNSFDALIGFGETGTDSVDFGFDARRVSGDNTLELFSYIGENNYFTQYLPPLTQSRIIDLGTVTSVDGNYTLSANMFQNFDSNTRVYLEDLALGVFHPLNLSEYNFMPIPTFNGVRFRLHFMASFEVEQTITCEGENNGTLLIKNPNTNYPLHAILKNESGETVDSVNALTGEFQFSNLGVGNYFLQTYYFQTDTVNTPFVIEEDHTLTSNFSISDSIVQISWATIYFESNSSLSNNPIWNFGDGTIAENVITPIHTYVEPGVFEINLTVNNGKCWESTTKYITVTSDMLGIDKPKKISFEVSPNPTHGITNINFLTPFSGIIEVASVDGKLLFSKSVDGQKTTILKMDEFANGVYLLNIKTNGIIQTEKIVVAR